VRDPKYWKILLAKQPVISRYLDYLGEKSGKGPDFVLDTYKKLYNLTFLPVDPLSPSSSLSSLQSTYSFDFLSCDLGVNYLSPYFPTSTTSTTDNLLDLDSIPYDTILLSVFQGETEAEMTGPPFTGVEALLRTFNLTYQSRAIESIEKGRKGEWRIQVYSKKSQREYQRTREVMEVRYKEEY